MDINITQWPRETDFPWKLIADLGPHLFWGLIVLIVFLTL